MNLALPSVHVLSVHLAGIFQQAAGVKSWLQVGEIWTTASIIPRNLCTTEVKSRILAKRQCKLIESSISLQNAS